jgi:hypothetical protein
MAIFFLNSINISTTALSWCNVLIVSQSNFIFILQVKQWSMSKFVRLWQASGRRLLGALAPSTWAPEPLILRSESSWPDSVTWRPWGTSPGWRLRSVSIPGILWECGRYVVANRKGTPAWELTTSTVFAQLFCTVERAEVMIWKLSIKFEIFKGLSHTPNVDSSKRQRVLFQINVDNAQSD